MSPKSDNNSELGTLTKEMCDNLLSDLTAGQVVRLLIGNKNIYIKIICIL